MNIPIKVYGVVSDPNTEARIVILKWDQDTELLPIWVGASEGNSICFALEGIAPSRPMTHDLLKKLLGYLDVQVEKVVIQDMNNSTYFATIDLVRKPKIEISQEGISSPPYPLQELTIDARPSDAIALALRMDVPIYVSEELLQKYGSGHLDAWLSRLKPKDVGGA
jgi:hypothetical protein